MSFSLKRVGKIRQTRPDLERALNQATSEGVRDKLNRYTVSLRRSATELCIARASSQTRGITQDIPSSCDSAAASVIKISC
jgi:hypothetical protein